MHLAPDVLDRILDTLSRALSPEVAREILALRADDATLMYVDELADRANEGTLSPDDLADYESFVAAANLVAILQAKARTVLAATSAA